MMAIFTGFNELCKHEYNINLDKLMCKASLIARFMGSTCGPSGADRTQVGPMMVPWTLLSGISRFRRLPLGKYDVFRVFMKFRNIISALVDTEIWIFDRLYICYQHWRFTDDRKIQGCFHDIRTNFTVKCSVGSSTLKRKYYFNEVSITCCIAEVAIWQLPMELVMKISSTWKHIVSVLWTCLECYHNFVTCKLKYWLYHCDAGEAMTCHANFY